MLQLTDTQQVKIHAVAVDKKGAPSVAPSVSFSSSDANVAAVTQDASDPSSALVVAGLPGSCQVKAVVTLADGSVVEGVLDLTVVGGAAVSVTLNADTPSEQA